MLMKEGEREGAKRRLFISSYQKSEILESMSLALNGLCSCEWFHSDVDKRYHIPYLASARPGT